MTWIITLLLLLLCTEPTPLEIKIGGLPADIFVQDKFYDFATGDWLVSKDNALWRLFCYNGPKIYFIIPLMSALAVLMLFFPKKFWARRGLEKSWFADKPALALTLASVAIITLGCNQTKAISNVYCPYENVRYGGHAPYIRVFEKYPPAFYAYQKEKNERGRGFPAGHASGGFAMMGLALLARRRRWQIAAILFGCALGWQMGGYQMLRGAHYLSHTLVTWCVAAIVITIAAKILSRK